PQLAGRRPHPGRPAFSAQRHFRSDPRRGRGAGEGANGGAVARLDRGRAGISAAARRGVAQPAGGEPSGFLSGQCGYAVRVYCAKTTVIASEAKQSKATAAALRSLDCFVASLLAMTVQGDRKSLETPLTIDTVRSGALAEVQFYHSRRKMIDEGLGPRDERHPKALAPEAVSEGKAKAGPCSHDGDRLVCHDSSPSVTGRPLGSLFVRVIA